MKNFRDFGRDSKNKGDRSRDARGDNRKDAGRDGHKPAFRHGHSKPAGGAAQDSPRTPRLSGPLLWGVHAVASALVNPHRQINRIIVTENGGDTIADALAQASASGIKRPKPEVLDKTAFDRLVPQGSVHQGIVAAVDNLEERDAHDLIASLPDGADACIVILDQVTDPHNVGAILRSAAAFGATGIIMQDRHAPELSGVLAKTASGAADVIPVAVETNLSRTIELLQEHAFFVVGLDERGAPIHALPRYGRVALVLGAEGAGLRRLVADHCDSLASLPTQGPILSLNVSNAAAVALYALKASA